MPPTSATLVCICSVPHCTTCNLTFDCVTRLFCASLMHVTMAWADGGRRNVWLCPVPHAASGALRTPHMPPNTPINDIAHCNRARIVLCAINRVFDYLSGDSAGPLLLHMAARPLAGAAAVADARLSAHHSGSLRSRHRNTTLVQLGQRQCRRRQRRAAAAVGLRVVATSEHWYV